MLKNLTLAASGEPAPFRTSHCPRKEAAANGTADAERRPGRVGSTAGWVAPISGTISAWGI